MAQKLNGLKYKKKKVNNTSLSRKSNLVLSGDISNSEGYPDNFLFKIPLKTNNSVLSHIIKENTEHISDELKIEDNIKYDIMLEEKMLVFISESIEGRKVSEITEFIKTINENSILDNNSVQDFLLNMIKKCIIKKYRYRYFVVNDN